MTSHKPSPSTLAEPVSDPLFAEHEQVVFCHDPRSGLRAIIAIHSTRLGPALGGTRFHPYADVAAARDDVLNLARGMTYKNALAGLDLGGGKAVILGDPATAKSEALLRAFGRFVQSLGGRYYTACDVGTYSPDMDVVARETRFVTGRTADFGGGGDSSVLTAWGVYQGMRAAAQHRWGSPDLRGRRIGIAGAGKVGRHLTDLLVADDASLVVADTSAPARSLIAERHPGVEVRETTDELLARPLEVYAPCAMGNAIDAALATAIDAEMICGGANNQLADDRAGDILHERGVLYAPDYCVNAGGVIHCADELEGYDHTRAKARVTRIFDTTAEVLRTAAEEGISPATAADRVADRRIADVGRNHVWLP